ncbi:MBL fold metallo-hydrolase [Thalassospiraceae bacterium LMO-JJ14]|nr:MBL fold metallo-hydrolase [Thalassospiraceae bacterium LMO-JJ14]
MELTFVGCGDAFGTGGRFNTCFYVQGESTAFLIDCGASSMVAIRKHGVDPNSIDAIVLTHLHGDHFAGIPFFILDAQLYSKRDKPLTVAGPPGTEAKLREAMELLFPGSADAPRKFETHVIEMPKLETTMVAGLAVETFPVSHACGSPPYALRITLDGKTVAYTGDTQWCDGVAGAGKEADLFITECLFFDKQVKGHLDLATIAEHLPDIAPKRLILTHFGPDMMQHVSDVTDYELAEDGKTVSF